MCARSWRTWGISARGGAAAGSSRRRRSRASSPPCAPSYGMRWGRRGFRTRGLHRDEAGACRTRRRAASSSWSSRHSKAKGRCRCGTAPWSSSCTPPDCGARRRSRSISATSTLSRSSSTCAAAKAQRTASSRSARRRRTGSRCISATRGRGLHAVRTTRCSCPRPASGSTRVCDALAGRRRRPADDPGAARAQLALDDAGLLARGCQAAAEGLRLGPPSELTAGSDTAGV
jgi:hypothetical protein